MRFRINSLASLALSGLLLLGGCGGGGSSGGGGSGLPTASNPAIDPPPAGSLAITPGSNETNGTIAAAVFEAVDGVGSEAGAAGFRIGLETIASSGLAGVKTNSTVTPSARRNIANIVGRHVEKIRAHQGRATVTGAQIVETIGCGVNGTSGTSTFVFDDVSKNFSEILVNCDDDGTIEHGTISSSNISILIDPPGLDGLAGSLYSIEVFGSITIDLKITTASPAEVEVIQGSFGFRVTASGLMDSDGASVFPGDPLVLSVDITNGNLLAFDDVTKKIEQLSKLNLSLVVNNPFGLTDEATVFGSFTYASTEIDGAITVEIINPIVIVSSDPNPSEGAIEITAIAPLSGKIALEILKAADSPGVQILVFSGSEGLMLVDAFTVTWPDFLLRNFSNIELIAF